MINCGTNPSTAPTPAIIPSQMSEIKIGLASALVREVEINSPKFSKPAETKSTV